MAQRENRQSEREDEKCKIIKIKIKIKDMRTPQSGPCCQTTFASIHHSRRPRSNGNNSRGKSSSKNSTVYHPLFAKGHNQSMPAQPVGPPAPPAPAPPPARHDMSVILVTGSYDHEIRFWEAWSGICSRTIARSGESGVRVVLSYPFFPLSLPTLASKPSSNLPRVRRRSLLSVL